MKVRMSGRGLDLRVDKVRIPMGRRSREALVLSPREPVAGAQREPAAGEPRDPSAGAPCVLWIHGGGYATGMKEMVFMGRAVDLVTRYGAVVVSPSYTLSWHHPYPAALNDCYAALLWLRDHARELGANPSQLMVGGESAGGGLAAALCLLARDRGEVSIAFQMPLYPMIDNLDTDSSRDNHAKVWNTKRNRQAWALYLRKDATSPDVSPYAAPARATDLSDLPPAYSFVTTAEPFLDETKSYFARLRAAGVPAELDVYEGLYHAFDMYEPDRPESVEARERFCAAFARAKEACFADQPSSEAKR